LIAAALCLLAGISAGDARANGGPFVVKYPSGDPAAKGALARLDPSLKPARESRLRVVDEKLEVSFGRGFSWRPSRRASQGTPPLVRVKAIYRIQNPTPAPVEIDFGFPILRGIYVPPYAMFPRPQVSVRVDDRWVSSRIISNSVIYGLIRQQARAAITRAIEANPRLAALVTAAARAAGEAREAARRALAGDVSLRLGWNAREAALLVEYASLDFGALGTLRADRGRVWGWSAPSEGAEFVNANLGPLAAIGEQKATQFFAMLAARFDPQAAASYEAIFEAWGGDVRERSVDLRTGEVRPRELSSASGDLAASEDPTLYARVDYLDRKARLRPEDKASCRAVLQNLPVVFTFAPMNLLHYRVEFQPGSTRTVTVEYAQFAYLDTRSPRSYQLAYVVHPASLWDEFGPIHLRATVPEGMPFRASVPTELDQGEERSGATRTAVHRATLSQKRGEIFLAVDADSWEKGQSGPGQQPRR
jgi:hypothetical protein